MNARENLTLYILHATILHIQYLFPTCCTVFWSLLICSDMFQPQLTGQLTWERYELKKKTVPLQAWRGPEGSRRLRLPDVKTIGTWRW